MSKNRIAVKISINHVKEKTENNNEYGEGTPGMAHRERIDKRTMNVMTLLHKKEYKLSNVDSLAGENEKTGNN